MPVSVDADWDIVHPIGEGAAQASLPGLDISQDRPRHGNLFTFSPLPPPPSFLPGSSIPEIEVDADRPRSPAAFDEGKVPGESADWTLPRSSIPETKVDADRPRSPAASDEGKVPGESADWRRRHTLKSSVTAVESPANSSVVSHVSTGEARDVQSLALLPRGNFSLRGELLHVFVCYRVAAEGPTGNGLSSLLAARIRALSLDPRNELQIPRHGKC
jgi:hypothetical protein